MNNRKRRILLTGIVCAVMLSSCSRLDGSYYVTNNTYADSDIKSVLGLTFSSEYDKTAPLIVNPEEKNTANYTDEKQKYSVYAYEDFNIYSEIGGERPIGKVSSGDRITLLETGTGKWTEVSASDGEFLGYSHDAFNHVLDTDLKVYAELPVEYGKARTNSGDYVDAYSHLVDIRKYFNVYSSTDEDNSGVDITKYDIKVSMKLCTDDTSIGEPFYNSNLCMLQYDTIQKLKQAVEKFRNDGYTVVIYDAYRPTSVQQKWFNVVQVHKWIANPAIGMGGVHDRGTAIDMSLLDKDGNELEMPTKVHTFTDESARWYTESSQKAQDNMNYMLDIMTSCGFDHIESEWWHFQDSDTAHYLPTDHDIDKIPLVSSEQ